MKAQRNERRAFRAGYSLVEVTLALLVVAIGLTATFALFPEGLKATRAAVDDTEIAMFAEYVFTTMDLAAAYASAQGKNWTISDTDRFKAKSLADTYPGLIQEGENNVFYWIPEDYDLGDKNYDAAKNAGFYTSAFTYDLTILPSAWKGILASKATKYAVLKVWPGEYGGARPSGEPRIFYREILPNR